MFSFFTLAVALLVLYLFCKYLTMRPKNFPPGPPNYPLIGGLMSLPAQDIHFTQEEWLPKYGPVVGLMMGTQPGVFIQGLSHVMDALKKPEFQGRPKTDDLRERSFGKLLGIFFSDGDRWLISRKFTVKYLRSFGSKNMEEIMQREMVELAERIQSGKSYKMTEIFRESTVNIIWTIQSGSRCTVEDRRIQILLENITTVFRKGKPTGPLTVLGNLIPPVKRFDKDRQFQFATLTSLQEFLRDNIREHKDTLDPLHPRDFFDAYLIEQQKREDSGTNDGIFTEEDLIVISLDIFSAGYESLNSTLAFVVLYLLLHPDVQNTLHQELDKHLGSRKPTLADKPNLDYVEALVNEIYRVNTIAPVVATHRATEDTTFDNYYIPKNSLVLMSLWSVLQDKELWPEPEKFDPNRFLNEDKKFVRNSNLINFGVGRRMCSGDFIAQNVLFLYITTFFQKYRVRIDPNDCHLTTKALPGLTTSPVPFHAIIEERY